MWILHPLTVIAFLPVDICHKNKIKTNEPEIHWKNGNSEPQPKFWTPQLKLMYKIIPMVIWILTQFLSNLLVDDTGTSFNLFF